MKANKQESFVADVSAAPGPQHLACALCGATEAEQVLDKTINGSGGALLFRLWRCTACGLVRTEPQLTSQALEPLYREEYCGGIDTASPALIMRDNRHRTVF